MYHLEPTNFDLPGSDRGFLTSSDLDDFTYPALFRFPGLNTSGTVTRNQKFRHCLGLSAPGENLVDQSSTNPNLVSFNNGGEKGISGFSIDVSELSNIDNVDAGVLSIDLTFDYEKLGIGTFGGNNMDFPLEIEFGNGVADNGDIITAESLTSEFELPDALPTKFDTKILIPFNNFDHHETSLVFDRSKGGQGLNFNITQEVDQLSSSGSNLNVQQQFANVLINALNGQERSLPVGQVTETLAEGENFSLNMLPVNIGFLIKSSGTANFKIINGVFNADTQTVDFRLRLASVNLNVIDAQANFNIFAGTGFTEAQNLYGQLELVPTTIGGQSFVNEAGRTITDFRDTTSDGVTEAINHVFRGFEVISNIDYSSGGQSLSFKAGATHEFGIVYYDHRNRHGGVQRLTL